MQTLFITVGAPFYRHDGQLHVEMQTISGLRAWQANFGHVVGTSRCLTGPPPKGWISVEAAGVNPEEIRFLELPDGYDRRTPRSALAQARETLLREIRAADYAVYSFGGWPGDWGMVAADLSREHGLAHAIWLDRVESDVVLSESDGTWRGWLKSRIKSAIISRNEKRALAGADLAMLHGKTVYEAFRGISKNPCRSENIHLEEEDRIGRDAVRQKLDTAREAPLRILYTGRASPMKGPFQWLDTLKALKASGCAFEARWLGAGELLEPLRAQAVAEGLEADVEFAGFVSDRAEVRAAQRWAHVFLFCHLTDESPRAPIEALFAATPLVGFSDPFAADLVAEKGAGALVQRGDTDGLAAHLITLGQDRAALQDLIEKAAASAHDLTRTKVFAERAAQVRENLTR